MHTRVNDCLLMASLPTMADNPPEFLNRTDAAALLRVHPRTLDRWAAAGRVPVGRTPGGAPRYRRVDLLALLDPDAPAHRTTALL